MSISTLFVDAVGRLRRGDKTSCGTRSHHASECISAAFPDVSAAPPDSRRMIRQRRYCQILSASSELQFDDLSRELAWTAFEFDMAFVPSGNALLASDAIFNNDGTSGVHAQTNELVSVESFYVDRNCVTNADFLRFVQNGGYDDPQLWPPQLLPHVLQFVDSTGRPGPKFWIDGEPDADCLNHPVVGISWYEAAAYASWIGKRLLSTAEWQRCGTWPHASSVVSQPNEIEESEHTMECAGRENLYPWGNGFDPSRANLWASGNGATLAVDAVTPGHTINGVRQLIGNVWEWVDTQFMPAFYEDAVITLDQPMAEIRGGAFDTYFPTQATCQFRTGQPLLHRADNIGFRCCVDADQIAIPDETSSLGRQS